MRIEALPKVMSYEWNVRVRPEIRHNWSAASRRLQTWLRETVCGAHGHDLLLQVDRGRRVYLRCANCGHETPGWPTR
jgi:hypothetical protein